MGMDGRVKPDHDEARGLVPDHQYDGAGIPIAFFL